MTRPKGNLNFSTRERHVIKSLIKDLMTFGAREHEIIKALSDRTGTDFSVRTLYQLKKEIYDEEGPAETWLDEFVKFGIPAYYKRRLEEMEYLQRNYLVLFSEEVAKDKKNIYAIDRLGRSIAENSKILAEYGLAPPIITKIKSLMPLEIHDMNNRIETAKENFKSTKTYIKSLDVIESRNNSSNKKMIENGDESKTLSTTQPVYHGSDAESALFPPIDKNPIDDDGAYSETTTEDDNRVF